MIDIFLKKCIYYVSLTLTYISVFTLYVTQICFGLKWLLLSSFDFYKFYVIVFVVISVFYDSSSKRLTLQKVYDGHNSFCHYMFDSYEKFIKQCISITVYVILACTGRL